MRGVGKTGQHGHDSPSNQNARNPDTGADFVEQQVARNSKEQVAEKEDPSEQTELLAGDRQLLVHRQRRKPNVDPVEKADDVHQENKRENPHPHFPNRSGLNGFGTGVYFVAHDQSSVSSSRWILTYLPQSSRGRGMAAARSLDKVAIALPRRFMCSPSSRVPHRH